MTLTFRCLTCREAGKVQNPNKPISTWASCVLKDHCGYTDLFPKNCPYDGKPAKWVCIWRRRNGEEVVIEPGDRA